MASKKDKLLESAQRYVLKGQIDKAIKEYQQVVAIDPREFRFKQRLAELLVRDNRKQEAILQYEEIGRHYANNSYFLKAIAVYKQIQRLDPANPDIAFTIAALNRKQGLAGNALAEYGNAVALLEREGSLTQAVKVLREMLEVEGDHTATRFKIAELLHKSGDQDGAYTTLCELFKKLSDAGDTAAAQKASDRIAQLFPGRAQHQLELISQRLNKGDVDGAGAELQAMLKRDTGNLAVWMLFCDVLRRKGDHAGLRTTLERVRVLFPNEVPVHEEAIRLELSSGDAERAVALLELHLDDFIAAKEYRSADQLFSSLPVGLRGSARVQGLLRKLYEASGDWDKLNKLQEASAAASPAAPAAAPFAAAAPAAASLGSLAAVDAAPELPGWEDIELDFDEPAEAEDVALAVPHPVAAPSQAVPETSLELEWPDEPDPFAVEGSGESGDDVEESAELPWPDDLVDPFAQPAAADDVLEAAPGAPPAEEVPDFFVQEAPVAQEVELPAEEAPELFVEEAPELFEAPELPTEELPELFAAETPEFFTDEAPELFADEAPEVTTAGTEEAGEEAHADGLNWQDIFPSAPVAGEAELDISEAESHYDLAFAYKELGRYDAALKELEIAASNQRRRLDCLILQALCYHEKGETQAGLDLLEKGSRVAGLTAQEKNTVSYELASLYESAGAVDEAVEIYRRIADDDPAFRDAAQRVYLLAGGEPPEIELLEES